MKKKLLSLLLVLAMALTLLPTMAMAAEIGDPMTYLDITMTADDTVIVKSGGSWGEEGDTASAAVKVLPQHTEDDPLYEGIKYTAGETTTYYTIARYMNADTGASTSSIKPSGVNYDLSTGKLS